jgi:hypothetical protein
MVHGVYTCCHLSTLFSMAGLRCQLIVLWPRKCHCAPPQGAGAEQMCQGALQFEHLHVSLTTVLAHILTQLAAPFATCML